MNNWFSSLKSGILYEIWFSIAMSSMHNDDKIDANTGDKQKPEIVTYYDRTKNGVDLIDNVCSL